MATQTGFGRFIAPFLLKHHFANFTMNDVLTRNHYEMFGSEDLGPAEQVDLRPGPR